MSKDWPTTQEYLIDHLLRIIQRVGKTDPDENGIVTWDFGFGKDALTTYQPSSPEDQKEWNEQGREWEKDARDRLFCSFLGIQARDHMGIPKPLEKLRSELSSIDRQLVVDALKEAFPGEIELGYAYEMLSKLKDMVDRGKEAVEEIHMLPKVPRPVDKYMSEAASSYRYGFDLACVSLCRSALEEALKHRLEDCGLTREQMKQPEYDLKKLIDTATNWKILDRQHGQIAHKIRKSGNKLVHGDFKGKDVRRIVKEALFNSRLIIQSIWSLTKTAS